MTCSETGCEAKGDRRCGKCQAILCYGCWKFFSETFGGACSVCRTPPPLPEGPPLEKWQQHMKSRYDKGREKWNAYQKEMASRFCKHGHPMRGKNVLKKKDGTRRCRACHNLGNRERAARKRAEAKALRDAG